MVFLYRQAIFLISYLYMQALQTLSIIKTNIKPIAFKHSVTLINTIFLAVIVLLAVFGEFHEAVFLSFVVVINVLVGIIQDLRAKVTLEKLRILSAPKVVRLNNNIEQIINLEQIAVGDRLIVSLGDSIPTDGTIITTDGLEVNEALLTGESKNINKKTGSPVFAGGIVTAGHAVMEAQKLPTDTLVFHMTEKIKIYNYTLSPIQRTLTTFISYMSYLLLGVIIYVVVHGITTQQFLVSIVKNIAALTSTLVPQGLILATTVFFAYGALRLFRENVLLQEINATEKLCLIQNLCIDKTGTLTESTLTLEQVIPFGNYTPEFAHEMINAYLQKNTNTSQTMQALISAFPERYTGETTEIIPFSSDKKFGVVSATINHSPINIVVGAPDILAGYIPDQAAQVWTLSQTQQLATLAKRLILIARAQTVDAGLTQNLIPVALCVLSNPLRKGTKDIIAFFQNRGIKVRVISGDNPLTVKAIAEEAGVKHTDLVITGPEMAAWDDDAFEERVPAYHVFARVFPEQKEKIIRLLKRSGFTAMIGDGANDALAIKQADLGIAMFDGANATRQIAQVVLMNNSFAALPGGVSLAETILSSIELVASVFFNKIISGFLLFVSLAALGYTYPLSPRNDTIIGYATIWISIIFWTLFPAQKINIGNEKSFFHYILPFAITNGILTAGAAVSAYFLELRYSPHMSGHTLVVLTLMSLGFWFLYISPLAYGILITDKQRKVLSIFGGVLLLLVITVLTNQSLSVFFNTPRPTWQGLIFVAMNIGVFGWLQYIITKRWFVHKQ